MSKDDAPFDLSTVKIPSKTPTWNLDAWKFVPKAKTGPHPVIVMAHGFSANKKMSLAPYAESFANSGYACVVFDYRRFGDSDGTPRDCIHITEQHEDYRTVIAWVREQNEFDAQRVVLWGTSFAGAHSITLAAEKELKLACAIAQCPYVGGAPKPPLTVVLKVLVYGVADIFLQAIGRGPVYIPAVARPGEVGGLTSSDSYEGIYRLGRDKKDFPNRISASSMFELPFYHPSSKAPNITCPFLIIIAEKDELCPEGSALKAAASSDKFTAVKTPGGHFEMYPGSADHEKSLKAQLDFLHLHVLSAYTRL